MSYRSSGLPPPPIDPVHSVQPESFIRSTLLGVVWSISPALIPMLTGLPSQYSAARPAKQSPQTRLPTAERAIPVPEAGVVCTGSRSGALRRQSLPKESRALMPPLKLLDPFPRVTGPPERSTVAVWPSRSPLSPGSRTSGRTWWRTAAWQHWPSSPAARSRGPASPARRWCQCLHVPFACRSVRARRSRSEGSPNNPGRRSRDLSALPLHQRQTPEVQARSRAGRVESLIDDSPSFSSPSITRGVRRSTRVRRPSEPGVRTRSRGRAVVSRSTYGRGARRRALGACASSRRLIARGARAVRLRSSRASHVTPPRPRDRHGLVSSPGEVDGRTTLGPGDSCRVSERLAPGATTVVSVASIGVRWSRPVRGSRGGKAGTRVVGDRVAHEGSGLTPPAPEQPSNAWPERALTSSPRACCQRFLPAVPGLTRSTTPSGLGCMGRSRAPREGGGERRLGGGSRDLYRVSVSRCRLDGRTSS